jgi:trehalose 6-phosphate synthase/phosphatase
VTVCTEMRSMSTSQLPLPQSPARPPAAAGHTVIVSNRLPITARLHGEELLLQRSDGGLASGLRTVHSNEGGLWIGWSGLADCVPPAAHDAFARSLRDASAVPVPLSRQEVAGYYRGFSNGALWPALHGWIRQPVARESDWQLYRTVNERYADIVARHLRAGDRVWIHDYHLLLLPALLRVRSPDARIGFFLHTPFPPPALFAALPHACELLQGILGADTIGFHTRDYSRHFASGVRLLLDDTLRVPEPARHPRKPNLVTCPMGIDAAWFAATARKPDVLEEAARIRARSDGPLFVGVDRLDYTKGLPERLLAFERLLELEPALRGRARLIQIAVPSREEVTGYRETRLMVEAIVARVNQRFRTADWTPVDYRHCTVSSDGLVALYLAADVMLVTPLCDGMNLVAKEFVACRNDGDGVLVLSYHAGAAAELHAAVITDPADGAGLVRAFRAAIAMPSDERQARMRRLRLAVRSHDVSHWSRTFLAALGRPEPMKCERSSVHGSIHWTTEVLCAF